jgi:RHS repeat-associated protein
MKIVIRLFKLLVIVLFLSCFNTQVLYPCPTPPPETDPNAQVAVRGPDGSQPQTGNIGQNSQTMSSGDPVSTGGGEFRYSKRFLSLGGLIPLDFTLFYAPDLQDRTPLNSGRTQFPPHDLIGGFTSNTSIRMVVFDDTCENESYANIYFQGDTLVFMKDDEGNYMCVGPQKYQLIQNEYSFFLNDPYRESVYIFDSRYSQGYAFYATPCQKVTMEGEVIYILDRNNNRLSYTYDNNNLHLPIKIQDSYGRRLNFSYINSYSLSERNLSTVTDGYGRTVSFAYAQCGNNEVLASVTDPMGKATRFEYDETRADCTLIEKILRPLGNSHIEQTWTENPKGGDAVESQKDAYGNETTFNYQLFENNIITTVTYPNGSQRDFYHKNERYPLAGEDQAGKQFIMGYNSDDQMTSLTDRLGDMISYTYHEASGKVASITYANGDVFSVTYSAQDQIFTNPQNSKTVTFTYYNPVCNDYPDGTNEKFTYDNNGNIRTRVDRVGKTWTYTYNSRGQVLTETNPTGGVTTYTYNNDANLASKTDSHTGLTTYTYDTYKRLAQIDYPDGTSYRITYNANDLMTQVTDQRGVITQFEYDANSNLTRLIRAYGTSLAQTHQYQYDLMDRIMKFIDPAGKETQYSYTYWNGLSQTTYPDNTQSRLNYNTRQWINQRIDEAGKIWQEGRDDEGVLSSVTTPSGRGVGLTSNKLGQITEITDSYNNTINLDRDAMGRIIKIADRLNREVSISRDGEGRPVSITLPVVGTVTYTRNDLGLVSRITDHRGHNWDFSYTSTGLLSQARDPLNNIWSRTYDNMGRLSQITYPDGVTETRTYDGNGNLTGRAFSDGLTLSYTYDELDRLSGTGSVPVTLTYNSRDKITQTRMNGAVFGATYDDRSRVKTVTYDGQMTVTYTYDVRGLVTKVTDNVSSAYVQYTYDNDGLLIKAQRSNGVTTEIERDLDSNITRINHMGKGDMEFTVNAEGEVTRINESLPLDVVSFITEELSSRSYDAANQITSSGFSYDDRGRRTKDPERNYTWDSADRLTRMTRGSAGITYEYTVLGEVAQRTADGVATEYYYNYAVTGRPIMAEKTAAGYTRFYVYTPEGMLLYFIDLPKTAYFYHFNHIGTALFLTDSSGTVTDSYGYTPYGRMVKHQGTSDQPFTYVGQHGVRQEGETGLYHMRARYYDSLTARFISRDPIWPNLDDPKSMSPYQYAGQNPAVFIDPSGLDSSGHGDPSVAYYGDAYLNSFYQKPREFGQSPQQLGNQLRLPGQTRETLKKPLRFDSSRNKMRSSIRCHSHSMTLDQKIRFWKTVLAPFKVAEKIMDLGGIPIGLIIKGPFGLVYVPVKHLTRRYVYFGNTKDYRQYQRQTLGGRIFDNVVLGIPDEGPRKQESQTGPAAPPMDSPQPLPMEQWTR